MDSKRAKQYEGLVERRELLDKAAISDTLQRMAGEIAARHPDPEVLFLVGIRTGGVPIAERLGALIGDRVGGKVSLGEMDITLYRDDVFEGLQLPEVGATDLPRSLESRDVVLVDDVLFTGRTTRAALVQLMDFGRPRSVRLAVLVDRGHRELPIHADFVGLTVETTRNQSVRVQLSELQEPDRVVLYERSLP